VIKHKIVMNCFEVALVISAPIASPNEIVKIKIVFLKQLPLPAIGQTSRKSRPNPMPLVEPVLLLL